MFDFFSSIGDVFVNIFNFIKSTIETFIEMRNMILSFFGAAASVIAVLPGPVQAIIYAALALLIAFIVIELLRDFL